MNRLLVLLIILLPFCAMAQQQEKILIISKDSLNQKKSLFKLKHNWRYSKKDSIVFASPAYNDSGWAIINARVRVDSELVTKHGYVSRTDWYRLHFYVDSSMIGLPVAVLMSAYGASEIYLDGEKVYAYGAIKADNKSKFSSAETRPFILVIKSAGAHVLAVRFANYITRNVLKDEDDCRTGFDMFFAKVDDVFISADSAILDNLVIYVFIGTLFLVLAVVHLLLFLYYRAIWSNLYFSIFCLAMSSLVLILYLSNYGSNPSVITVWQDWVSPVAIGIVYFSFSGLNNVLFGKRKTLFYIIAVMSLACVVINFLNNNWASWPYAVTGSLVLIEAIVLPVIGIYRKVKGARIVGLGVLFFAIFMLTVVIWLAIKHNIFFSSGSIGSTLFSIFAIGGVLSIPFSMSVYLSWHFANTNRELKRNLQQVQLLSQQALEQAQEKKRIIESQKEQLEEEVANRTNEVIAQKEKIEKQHEELKAEKKKSDDLLLNILPSEIAEELKHKGYSEAKHFDHVTVLFTDFVNFTTAGEIMAPQDLVNELNVCFKAFDEIISRHKVEKIKTIGDAYLGVCGLPLPVEDHAIETVAAALEIRDFMAARRKELGDKTFEIRIGIHSGSVVAGIVGIKKFAYDVWGDTVNTAARIEQNSLPGKINISQSTWNLVKDRFECSHRGQIVAKNKGELSMYFVEGVKAMSDVNPVH